MVLLFFLALFLAWPTYGLSLLVYVVLIVARGVAQARARMHFANERRAMRSYVNNPLPETPSWFKTAEEVDFLFSGVRSAFARRGLPTSYVAYLANDKSTVNTILTFVAKLEREGSNYAEQQLSVISLCESLYGQLSDQQKRAFEQMQR